MSTRTPPRRPCGAFRRIAPAREDGRIDSINEALIAYCNRKPARPIGAPSKRGLTPAARCAG